MTSEKAVFDGESWTGADLFSILGHGISESIRCKDFDENSRFSMQCDATKNVHTAFDVRSALP